jgi:hypothetical protein
MPASRTRSQLFQLRAVLQANNIPYWSRPAGASHGGLTAVENAGEGTDSQFELLLGGTIINFPYIILLSKQTLPL